MFSAVVFLLAVVFLKEWAVIPVVFDRNLTFAYVDFIVDILLKINLILNAFCCLCLHDEIFDFLILNN